MLTLTCCLQNVYYMTISPSEFHSYFTMLYCSRHIWVL